MTAEAKAYLYQIENLYQAAGRPNHNVWYFDAGSSSAIHSELVALGLLSKVFGTEKGYAWRLTNVGLASLPPHA